MKTLVILSHPNLAASRANKALSQVAKAAADVEVRHLEGLYGLDIARIDARAEQDALAAAERIVFLYPMYWLNVPPMLKAYIDIVFSHELVGSGALKGKVLQLALSVSTPLGEYSKQGAIGFSLDEILTPLKITANYCGMDFAVPFISSGFEPGEFGDDAVDAGIIIGDALQGKILVPSGDDVVVVTDVLVAFVLCPDDDLLGLVHVGGSDGADLSGHGSGEE